MLSLEPEFREQLLTVSCAWAYGNEAEVGQGIKASGVPREELWITSKLFELHHHPEHVELAVKDTLKNLGLEYLDLYLMHWNVGLFCVYIKGNELTVRST
jgi:diketogulonate reductase-like aldo/keto reductase